MEVEKILPLVPENGESLLVENIAHAGNESYAIIALTHEGSLAKIDPAKEESPGLRPSRSPDLC